MIALVCPTCGEAADPRNRDGSWRVSGNLVEHVHDGIRSCCRPVEVVPAALAREGWRPRLAHVERLLAEFVARNDGVVQRYTVEPALTAVRALLDGDTSTEGLVRLGAEDFERVESWLGAAEGESFDGPGDRDLLDRLRREVGA